MLHISRFKVLSGFPIWRRKDDTRIGEIFEVIGVDKWPELDGAFYFPDSPRTEAPDFTGARLKYLIKNKYIGPV